MHVYYFARQSENQCEFENILNDIHSTPLRPLITEVVDCGLKPDYRDLAFAPSLLQAAFWLIRTQDKSLKYLFLPCLTVSLLRSGRDSTVVTWGELQMLFSESFVQPGSSVCGRRRLAVIRSGKVRPQLLPPCTARIRYGADLLLLVCEPRSRARSARPVSVFATTP